MAVAFAAVEAQKKICSNYRSMKELQLILPQSWQLKSGFAENDVNAL